MKPVTIREIVMFAACIILSFFLFVKKWNNSELEKDKARAEERIKMYEQSDKEQHRISDSLKANTEALQAVIEYQKKNPQIIREKYEKVRDNIHLLNADQSIGYLTNRLSQAGGNR